MGGDVGSLVADASLPAVEKHRVAAVLAYQRAFGATVTPLPPAVAATPRAELVDARVRFRLALSRLLTDTVRLGVSHLSPAVHQRFETMAVWAQGVEYHRLALILRRLADQIELLLTRSARADEHLLLDQSAIAFALVTALDRAPDEPRLVGQARNRYDDVRSMTVVGLGGLPWRSGTGYHGLTCLFWWPEESRFVSWTDARPQSLGGFDPRSRCTQPGPWTGLRSPAESFGRAVRLTGARLSAVGRLSGVERTHASVSAADPDELPPVVEDWSELEARGRASLLDLPDPLNDWVLLRPAGFGRAVYNPVRQVVEWQVVDRHRSVLTLRLRWTSVNAHAVNRLETLGPADLADGTVVVARVFRDAGTTLAEPLSLIRSGGVVDAAHFDGPPPAAAANLPDIPDDEPGLDTEVPDTQHSALPDALRQLRNWLVSQAERGTAAASAGGVLAELDSRHRALREAGFSLFAEPGAADSRLDPAEAMLRTHYLYLQTAAVLT